MTNLRVGNGYDVHRLQDNLNFLLGGINISHSKGIVAHSDGDILLHTISDALLGAAALGDIGCFFPDTESKYKNLNSVVILDFVLNELKNLSFQVVNIDIIIVLERPKLNPFIPQIKQSLSHLLHIGIDRLNIKATTSEKMGFIGREEGVACYATVLIEKI
jgi:2-C-methyl-D-erythritol 2,4-cyclodiphosphate synthase